jgi:hypothetical protein
MLKAKKKSKKANLFFNAHPDTLKFRDKMFTATLCEVPARMDMDKYKKWKGRVLDQGSEGACKALVWRQ